MSRQVIFEYNEAREAISFLTEDGVEDYMALKADVFTLLESINNGEFSPQSGSGSPEGLIKANRNGFYIDTDINQLYVNLNYEENTGWLAV